MKNATYATGGKKKLPISLRYVKNTAQTAVRHVVEVCRDVVRVTKPTICTYRTYAVIQYSLLHVSAVDSHFHGPTVRDITVSVCMSCVCKLLVS